MSRKDRKKRKKKPRKHPHPTTRPDNTTPTQEQTASPNTDTEENRHQDDLEPPEIPSYPFQPPSQKATSFHEHMDTMRLPLQRKGKPSKTSVEVFAPIRPLHQIFFFSFLFVGMVLFFGSDLLTLVKFPFASNMLDMNGVQTFLNVQARGLTTLLASVITLCAIAIPLTANNYTPKLISLFVNNPINQGMLALLVVSCILTHITLLTIQLPGTSHGPEVLGVGILSTLCFGLIIPDAFFVFRVLQPEMIISHIEEAILKDLRRAETLEDKQALAHKREYIVQDLKYLSNIALRSLERRDRDTTLLSIESLRNVLDHYFAYKQSMPKDWFALSNVNFLCQSGEMKRQIQASNTFIEAEVMAEYALLLDASFGKLQDVVRMISESMRHIGLEANEYNESKVLEMTALYFNSFLRRAISKRRPEAIYMLAYHYRRMGEEMLSSNPERTIKVAFYLDYYGHQAVRSGMIYVANLIAYDLAEMTQKAFTEEAPCKDTLFDIFVHFDQDEKMKSLPGVIKSHIKLATTLESIGAHEYVKTLCQTLSTFPQHALAQAVHEIESVKHPLYWEITDRREHMDYIPPHLQAHFQRITQKIHERHL